MESLSLGRSDTNLYEAPHRDFNAATKIFVCVRDGHSCYILMSSDLHLQPTEIITIYSYRSKIEVMFLFLKHLIGGFCYHFWTKAFPKLKRGKKPDLSILSKPDLEKVDRTVKAIECFINLAGIAMGLLQYLSLTQAQAMWNSYQGWLRTRSSDIPSEGVVQNVLQAEFFSTEPLAETTQIDRVVLHNAP
jgi:hypothetical protein